MAKASTPVPVMIYGQENASEAYSHLKIIGTRGTRTLDKTGTFDVEVRFTMKDLFDGDNGSPLLIQKSAGSLVVDRDQLHALAPQGKVTVPGYVTELRCVGRYNDSPATLMFGAPDVTRTSFTIVQQLSDKAALPDTVEKKLRSGEPMLTTVCPPMRDFPVGSKLGEAIEAARTKDGLVLYSSTDDGGIMSQNPKAMIIIDECAGASERALRNTYVEDKRKGGIHTPGNSLISALVRCYPSSKVRLIWEDKGGKDPFEVDKDVLFFIPEKVANFAIKEVVRRKDIVSKLRMPIKDIAFAVQASPMHGDWRYDGETDSYINHDNGHRCDANQEFTFRARLAISMRYNVPHPDECALARDHQFYPMPVWPRSGIVNGLSKPGVTPYPSTLYDQVAERLNTIAGEQGRKRRAATLKCIEGSEAASSVADDD